MPKNLTYTFDKDNASGVKLFLSSIVVCPMFVNKCNVHCLFKEFVFTE